jgi:uridine phosphorylase
LVVGDPARAQAAALMLDAYVEVGRNREYVTYRGNHGSVPVAVVSHGVGAAGAAICFEELCQAGVQRIIRAGTAGGLQSQILDGNLVIVTGAVRDEGVSPRIVPISYPATPALEIVGDIESASEGQDSVHKGIVLSTDLFYPHKILGSNMKLWQESGVVAVEMECSILFVIASLHRKKSGAILAIDGNPLAKNDEEMSAYNPYRSVVKETVDIALKIALDALIGGQASSK